MDEFLGFRRRERLKPSRPATTNQGTFWLLFVPAKSDWRVTPQASYFPKPQTRQTSSLPPENKKRLPIPIPQKQKKTINRWSFPLNIHKKSATHRNNATTV
ncbi:hypothetical protein ACTWWB_002533 [Vibrio fluvialis]|nr:hypothetical protein [Vibrio fluvialis]EKZ9000741.1 hypothetical protein [Vibrio fluvialis]ELI1829520.1 hypothetical protein [Vibrio fluvialis]